MRVGRAVLRSGGSRVLLVLAIALLTLSGPAASEAFSYEYDGRVVHAGATADATPDTPVDLHQQLEASASRAVRYAYDAPADGCLDVGVLETTRASFPQVTVGGGESTSPAAGVAGASMTPVVSLVTPSVTPSPGHWGGEFLDDAIRSPVVRPDLGNLSSKIQRRMGQRGWTPELIDEAVLQGRSFSAVNKLGGANTPATRYVHPRTGQSVVIDNATGEVIQVGGPGFGY